MAESCDGSDGKAASGDLSAIGDTDLGLSVSRWFRLAP